MAMPSAEERGARADGGLATALLEIALLIAREASDEIVFGAAAERAARRVGSEGAIVLIERGLAAALQELTARAGVPVDLRELPRRRFPALAESTAYFVVADALALARSRATKATVRVGDRGDRLLVEVRDDGTGGVDGRLPGLAERVAAVGGRLNIGAQDGGTSCAPSCRSSSTANTRSCKLRRMEPVRVRLAVPDDPSLLAGLAAALTRQGDPSISVTRSRTAVLTFEAATGEMMLRARVIQALEDVAGERWQELVEPVG